MGFAEVDAILLRCYSIALVVVYAGSIWYAERRQTSSSTVTTINHHNTSTPPPQQQQQQPKDIKWSDRPLAYWMKRVGLVQSLCVFVPWSVDPQGGLGVYTDYNNTVLAFVMITEGFHLTNTAIWIFFTAKYVSSFCASFPLLFTSFELTNSGLTPQNVVWIITTSTAITTRSCTHHQQHFALFVHGMGLFAIHTHITCVQTRSDPRQFHCDIDHVVRRRYCSVCVFPSPSDVGTSY